jgi:alpha-1,2-mannosyltransferase
LKINLTRELRFVYLHQRKWVEASRYPFFTLLGQSLGSVVLGLEALIKFTPDFFIDTMGYAFTYPLFSIVCGSRVACYTHYPTISTDMLTLVSSSTESFNNRPLIAKSSLLTQLKLLYYRLFAQMYGLVGRFSDLIMVNSSWTRNHIKDVWSLGDERVHLVYPPCDTQAFQSLSLAKKLSNHIISIAQFRPEKNHAMQLIAFKRLLEISSSRKDLRLSLVGSCRNKEDEDRVQRLDSLTKELGLRNQV